MKLCTTLLILTLLGVSNAAGVFSDYSIYNAFFQGPFTCANSDVQGRLAAAGDVSLTNYQVGCNSHLTSNPSFSDQCPQQGVWTCATLSNLFPGLPAAIYGLASGGNIQWTNGALYGGAASGSNANAPALSGVSHFTDCPVAKGSSPSTPVNYAAEASYISSLSTNVAALPATGTYTLSFGTLTLTGSGAALEVFDVSGADLSATNTLVISAAIPVTTTIVINVNGSSVTFAGGFDGKARSATLFWNLFQATSINLNNYAFFGSLVAPNADFVNPAGVFWGQIFAKSFTSTSTCAQINFVPFTGNVPNGPPPPPQCGDGVVQPSEQCDLGTALNGADSTCCDANCHLKPKTVVCRPSAGECDVAESCDGINAQCPADAFLPATTPCSSLFGICDLRLKYHCPGNGPSCEHLAPAPLWYWDAYNVLSFDSYTCHGGDVEGRLAARNHVDLSGFRLGEKTVPTDVPSFLALLVAGDATWTDGTVLPATEYIGVGGVFTAPADLQARTIQPPALITTGQFDAAFTYYVTIQQELAALETNVDAAIVFTDGLQLTCHDSTSDLYHVRVPASLISVANWYLTVGCKFGSGWILDITGSDDVTIKGAPFPGVVERVVYNVLGTGRTISANNGVAANILAPSNIYTQSGGVTYGRLIAGNILQARQNNKPNCINFAATTLNNKNLKAVNIGDTFIYLVDISSYVVGDLICLNGDCKKVVSGSVGDLDGDGVVDHVVNVDAPFQNSFPADMLISTPITNANDRNPLQPTVITPPPTPTYANVKGSASSVAISFFVLLAALLL